MFYSYIDDIIIYYLNDYNFTNLPIYYPVILTIGKNSIVSNSINFLDLRIFINFSNNVKYDIYSKYKNFSFSVNLFTHYSTCLHKSVFTNILLIMRIVLKIYVQINLSFIIKNM